MKIDNLKSNCYNILHHVQWFVNLKKVMKILDLFRLMCYYKFRVIGFKEV